MSTSDSPPGKAPAAAKAAPAKPDVTSTGRNRTSQHVDARRLGRYR
jgi:hypothetical protein